jgi:hypothetical protein
MINFLWFIGAVPGPYFFFGDFHTVL